MSYRCMETLRALLEVNVNFEISCYDQYCGVKANAKAITPCEYALYFNRFDVVTFLANFGVNTQGIRRFCRRLGIQKTLSAQSLFNISLFKHVRSVGRRQCRCALPDVNLSQRHA